MYTKLLHVLDVVYSCVWAHVCVCVCVYVRVYSTQMHNFHIVGCNFEPLALKRLYRCKPHQFCSCAATVSILITCGFWLLIPTQLRVQLFFHNIYRVQLQHFEDSKWRFWRMPGYVGVFIIPPNYDKTTGSLTCVYMWSLSLSMRRTHSLGAGAIAKQTSTMCSTTKADEENGQK